MNTMLSQSNYPVFSFQIAPGPWVSLREMSDNDLLAIYQFVRSLKPAGDRAPAYAGPEQAVNTPYYDFMPKNLPATAMVTNWYTSSSAARLWG